MRPAELPSPPEGHRVPGAASPPSTVTGPEASELVHAAPESGGNLVHTRTQRLPQRAGCSAGAPAVSHKTEAAENRQESPGVLGHPGWARLCPIC